MNNIQTPNSLSEMAVAANNIRGLAASMVEQANSGHPGGAMGGADYVNVLFSEFLVHDPENPAWENRDRFFLDPGHMSPMLYSVLGCTGKYSLEDLSNFRQWGSITPGHPERDVQHGVENTSGPLGQGHTFAVGAAVAAKCLEDKFGTVTRHKIYAYISDGGIQEEISQGSGRIAGHLCLNNLIMFYDSNDIQLSTSCDKVTSENVELKYQAWGWEVITIDGNDTEAIRKALIQAQTATKPFLIIGKTVMGKGSKHADNTSFENDCATHGAPFGGDAYRNTISNLGMNPDAPFEFLEETKAIYARRRESLIQIVAERNAEKAQWEKDNAELAAQYVQYFSNEIPQLDWSKVEQASDKATRAASATCLGFIANNVDNMIVSSADLSNSDKTDGFLKQTHAITANDFSGRFLQAGVAELTMACMCIGIELHGGMHAACATFFVFSDYMKPAVRMAALMEVPVKFIWSHDAFRVGEDGPTHEPVEQEAQIRLMEKLQNHSGKNSLMVFRPADVFETTEAYKAMLENNETPSAIILSRQNIKDLPGNRLEEAKKLEKGAYIVNSDENPEVIALASGSEVSTLQGAADILRAQGRRIRIVSVPSEGIFRTQSKDYQNEVLIPGVPRFGLTAGLPVNLEGLVGDNGKVYGLNSFGFSAPYTVLDEKLGFTSEQVAKIML